VDHKTAHFKKEDKFHDQFVIQVTGYAWIAEALALGEVSLAGLFVLGD
jgi:hypothetical protein